METTTAQLPRKLNMEEKRKLEKLLIADIESAAARYEAAAKEGRDTLTEKLTDSPLPEAKALHERYTAAGKEREHLQGMLRNLGYEAGYNRDELTLTHYGPGPKQLEEYDEGVKDMRCMLLTLKRDYIVKLFSGSTDTRALFEELQRDLQRLVG